MTSKCQGSHLEAPAISWMPVRARGSRLKEPKRGSRVLEDKLPGDFAPVPLLLRRTKEAPRTPVAGLSFWAVASVLAHERSEGDALDMRRDRERKHDKPSEY